AGNGGQRIEVGFNIRGSDLAALEGVDICEADTRNCATTDGDGAATIELPVDQEVVYTVSKAGFAAELYAEVTDSSFSRSRAHVLFPNEEIDDAAAGIMSVWPHAGTGWVSLGVNLEGVTFELIDAAGAPWYVDSDGVGKNTIDATTSEAVGGARGGFVEVAPGVVEVEYGGTATGCTVNIGLPSESPNRIKLPVRDAHISFGSMTCTQP
ncbi:MAG: hypothetical protein WBN10_10565, partial [Polyangiales bacterium]